MMEARIQEAIQYMNGFPDAKITAVAKDFGVSRWSLRRRLEGVGVANTDFQLNRCATAKDHS